MSNSEVEQVKAGDLAGMEAAKAPKKTWFFQRLGDKKIFAAEVREAWDIFNNRGNWRRHDFKCLGTSDGTTYQKVIRESRKEADRLQPQIDEANKELERYRKAEENLITNEAVDMDGDAADEENEANKRKVLRLRGIIKKLEDKAETLEEQFRSLTKNIVQTAFDAELAVAKKNGIEDPGAQNIMTPGATSKRRRKILNLLDDRDD